MSTKSYSFFSITPRFYLFLAVFAIFSLGAQSARLNTAWRELADEAATYTSRGVALADVVEEKLAFGANDAITVKAVHLYLVLLDDVFTTMRHQANFETSRALRDTQTQLFSTLLQHPGVRQRVAHAVFKNYKKWNITFTSWSGEVEHADIVVFAAFLGSLNQQFFSGLLGFGPEALLIDDFNAFRAQVVRLLNAVKPSELGVRAREEKNKIVYATKSGMNVISKKVGAVTGVVGRKIKQISFKNVFYNVGAVSAIGVFLLGSYAFIYRKKVLRQFGAEIIKIGGGIDEVAKEAALLYSMPETRWKRIFSRARDWVYNDPEIRKDRAGKLQKEFLIAGTRYVPTSSAIHDELTNLLKFASADPREVKPGMADRVKKEWADDLRYRDLQLKKKRAEAQARSRKESGFRKAAAQYLKILAQQERDLAKKA